ncbi:guanylate kinase [compost metagenome]
MAGRGTDSVEKLAERYAKAEKELAYAPQFDVILENYELETACEESEVFVKYFLKDKMKFGKREVK